MLLLINKIKDKLLRLYNQKIFSFKIYNKVQNCGVLGKVNYNATNHIIGNNITMLQLQLEYPQKSLNLEYRDGVRYKGRNLYGTV